jgi:hypothetical protein
MSKTCRWSSIVALAVAGILSLAEADGKSTVTKPFFMEGCGAAPDGASVFGLESLHDSHGVGAFLGRYSGNDGHFFSLSFDPETLSGTFHGSFVFVGANGDRLACTYGDTANGADSPGRYWAQPAKNGKFILVFVAEFNPILEECTGKFANLVGGSFETLAVSEPIDLVLDENGFTPPFDYFWAGEGSLTFAK